MLISRGIVGLILCAGVAWGQLEYNGTTSYVYAPDSDIFTLGSNFAVSTWIKTTDTQCGLLSHFNASSPYAGWELALGASVANGKVNFWDGGAFNLFASGPSVADGIWHHIVVVFAVPNGSLYIDGKHIETEGVSTVGNASAPLYMGRDSNTTPARRFTGEMITSMIFPHALTAQDVANLYRDSGHWPVDLDTVVDYSGNGNDAVNTGADIIPLDVGYVAKFDSANDVIECGSDTTLKPASLTYSCWAKFDSLTDAVGNLQGLMDSSGAADNKGVILFLYESTGKVALNVFDGAWQEALANSATTTGIWNHYCATYDAVSKAVILYVDGIKQTITDTANSIVYDAASNLTIGQ